MTAVQRTKQATTYRMSPTALELLALISASLGIDKTATLEVIIREAAATRGISQLTTGATQ